MADIQEALEVILTGDAELIALVPAERIQALAAEPSTEYPYIRCQFVSGVEGTFLKGTGDGQFRERWQIDVYADKSAEAKAILNRLRDLLRIVEQTVTTPSGNVLINGGIPQGYILPRRDPDTRKWNATLDVLLVGGAV